MRRNYYQELLFVSAAVMPVSLTADPGQMVCESLPPTCSLCEHHYPGGTTYVCVGMLPQRRPDRYPCQSRLGSRIYHCYNDNYPYTVG